jgi:hypothetical protein
MMLFIVGTASALPTPHSIKGIVFDLDGATQVELPTTFNITNSATAESITGTVGKGPHTGRYSVSIDGYDGDLVSLEFKNKYHSAHKNITLQGVMDNVHIILNDSFPDNPPVIFSTPKPRATLGQQYIYAVDAFDNEDSILEYALHEEPQGMNIDATGRISWTPQERGVTSFIVSVTDTDGLQTNQTATVRVIPRNVPEIPRPRRSSLGRFFLRITESEPREDNEQQKNQIIPGMEQEDTEVEDDTSDEQEISPEDFITGNVIADSRPWKIIFGRIRRTVSNPLQEDTTNSIISVTDTLGNQEQFFSFSLFGKEFYIQRIQMDDIEITAKRHILTGHTVASLDRFINKIDITLNETLYATTPDFVKEGIAYYTQRPFPILKGPEKVVYKYLIDTREDDQENFTISIPTTWFVNHNVNAEDIAVYSYTNGSYSERYRELNSTEKTEEIFIVTKEDNDDYFVVTIQDQAYEQFLIAFQERLENQIESQSVTTKQQFLVRGIAYVGTEQQFPAGTPFIVTNKNTNATVQGTTGVAMNSGGFTALIEGERGDKISILVEANNKRFYREVTLNGDINIGREE